MRAKSGCIINIGSTAGIVADRGTLCYGTSKAALHHATKIMAGELGEFGIRVNSIAPGIIESGMSDKMDRIAVECHRKRMASPEFISVDDVVSAVDFLTSESASKFQGQILRLDNGFSAIKMFVKSERKLLFEMEWAKSGLDQICEIFLQI